MSSTRPGHYVEPSFSPDGQKIVFRHAGGDLIRAARSTRTRPGIYVVPAAGGEPLLAREGGSEPEFDHTGTRIYFRDFAQRRSSRCSAWACRRARRRCRPRRDRARAQPTTPPSSRSRPTASGSRSKSASRPSSRRSREPAVRSTSARRRSAYPGAAGLARRRASFCTGRATAEGCTGRWVRSCSRATWRSTFTFVEGGQPKADEPEAKGTPIELHRDERQARRDRSRSSARA